jgi:hypothetical protein
VVEGDPLLVDPIKEALARRGLAVHDRACGIEHVLVAAEGEAISVTIVDTDGRRSHRVIADTATAADVIESFAAMELLAPTDTAAVAAPARDAEQPDELVAATAHTSARGSIGAALETSIGSDSSRWVGAYGGGCVQLGALCVGGELRFAHNAQTVVSRSATDLLFSATVPVVRGPWTIGPGVGLGVGWMHASMAPDSGEDMIDVDTGGLRADVHVAASLRVTRSVLLTLGASLGLAPGAHVDPFTGDRAPVPGEPRMFGRVHFGVGLAR